ncbi:MAG: hypothetical protein EBX49_02600 [Synechococcaceae bacterium WB8_1B_136]|nr:hypothetical protein [Synechococcaceae bacterium WB8_1B_136]
MPSISKQSLQELRKLEQQLRDAQTRQEAMAAGVKLLNSDQPVRLDGQPLQVGDQQRLSSVFQLQVGDGEVLEIAPGGGQALEDLEHTVQNAKEQLTTRLSALQVASVAAADALLEQRTALEQQLAGLGAAPADLGELTRQNDALQQRLADLDAELQELEATARPWQANSPLRRRHASRRRLP